MIILIISSIAVSVVITSVIGVNHYMAIEQMELNQTQVELMNTLLEIQLLQMKLNRAKIDSLSTKFNYYK